MISMLAFCEEFRQLMTMRETSKKCFAMLSCDELETYFYYKIEEFRAKVEENPKLDIICYELEKESGISYAKYIRKCYEQAMLILMADTEIPPTSYIRPDIMPAGLIIKPTTHDDIKKVIWEALETYIERLDKNRLSKAYIVASKDGRTTIPYNKILYFESRNKKIYVRYDNKEIGFYSLMDELEKELDDDFIRIHRGFLVNKYMIRKVSLGNNIIILKNNTEVPLSRKYKDVVKKLNV